VAKNFRILREKIDATPEQRERAAAQKEAMRTALALGQLREQRGATQVTVAGTMGVSQVNVSRIEHEDDVYLSTLTRYVEALGGRLQIAAVFPDATISLLPLNEHSNCAPAGRSLRVR